jgi:HKD family nuclease
MKEQIIGLVRRFDPCLVFSIVSLIIIIPVGFTIDHIKLQSECSGSPIVYLGYNFSADRIPIQFEQFIQNATSEVELILASNHPHGDDNHTNYYVLLKSASDRNVAIKLVTDDLDMYENFTFCKERYHIRDPNLHMFAYIAQSDHINTIYSSDLLSQYICPNARFLLHFNNCQSVASDISSLFRLLADFSAEGFPKIFDYKSIPGSSFPQQHSLPGGGLCKFGMSPNKLVPPGRSDVVTLLSDFFDNFEDELSLITQSLFPISDKPSDSMPELLLSERIEHGALNQTKIKILVPMENVSNAHCQLRSLMQFPNVEIRAISEKNCTLPTLYTFAKSSGFLAIPFEQIMRTSPLTFTVHISEQNVAGMMKSHFVMLWNQSSKMNMTRN